MKRDMDFIRFLLLKAESQFPENWNDDFGDVKSSDKINYHLALLIEAGLLHGHIVKGQYQQTPSVMVERLTWEGHEFIDKARDEKIWKRAKVKVAEVGGAVSIEIFKKVLDWVIKQQLGINMNTTSEGSFQNFVS